MPTFVTNTKDHLLHCHSSDGNSVPVGPRAGGPRKPVAVANRFTWQVDEGIVLGETLPEDDVDPTAHVRGRPLTALRSPPRTAEEVRRIQAQGLHPHQTPQERAAIRRKAQKILDDQRRGSESSGEAVTRGRTPAPSRPERPAPDGDARD